MKSILLAAAFAGLTSPASAQERQEPPAPPRGASVAIRARADLASYVSDADYPPAAIRAHEEGRTAFRLAVGPDGRVSACTITESSGSAALDETTCRILRLRARFTPARDARGNPVGDNVSGALNWSLPVQPTPAPDSPAAPKGPSSNGAVRSTFEVR